MSSSRTRARLLIVAVLLALAGVGALGMIRVVVALGPFAAIVVTWCAVRRATSPALVRATSVLVSIAIGFILLDVGIRLFVGDSIYHRPEGRFGVRWPLDPRLHKMRPNQSWEGEVHGDLAAMSGEASYRHLRTVRLTTDRLGYRNDSVPAGPVDLILLGDSFGQGVGSTQTDTIAVHLEQRWGYETYNLSFPGGPWHELVRLKTELGHLPVREGTTVVWLLFEGNDLTDRYHEGFEVAEPRGAVAQALTRYASFLGGSPVHRMIRSVLGDRSRVVMRPTAKGEPFLFFDRYLENGSLTVAEVKEHENYPRLRDTVAEMKRFCDSENLSVVVALAPTKANVHGWIIGEDDRVPDGDSATGFTSALLELCAANGIRALDLRPALREEAERLRGTTGEFLWWRDDSHWNGLGQAVAARAIHDSLLD